jgi:hypothetical protein
VAAAGGDENEDEDCEGGRDEMDAIEGFLVGMCGDERRRVTSGERAWRCWNTSRSSSSSSV